MNIKVFMSLIDSIRNMLDEYERDTECSNYILKENETPDEEYPPKLRNLILAHNILQQCVDSEIAINDAIRIIKEKLSKYDDVKIGYDGCEKRLTLSFEYWEYNELEFSVVSSEEFLLIKECHYTMTGRGRHESTRWDESSRKYIFEKHIPNKPLLVKSLEIPQKRCNLAELIAYAEEIFFN